MTKKDEENEQRENDFETIDNFVLLHLNNFIKDRVHPKDQEAFTNYALSKLAYDLDHWMNVGWSSLYGLFMLKID